MNEDDSCETIFDGILFILLDKFVLLIVVAREEDDEDALASFITVDMAPNSVDGDLLAIGDVRNGDKHMFSCIGVFVLALAV